MKQIIEKKDFQLGKYYYIEYDEWFMLALNEKEIKDVNRIKGPYLFKVTKHSGQYTTSTPWITGRKCRIATYKEKYWLDMCITANKFIPQPTFIEPFYSMWF